MAFKGDLTNISLFDVFQTLSQNKQTGVLVLTRDGATKKVHISPDGVRIFFTKSFRPLKLGEIFVRRGRITSQDVEILLLEQKKQYRPMGELLIESGKVTEEEVGDVLRYHAEDEIFEVFGWNSGNFAFYDGQDAGDPATPLSDILMDPAGLCLEAARRLDELERLREAIPTNSEYYIAEGEPPDPTEAGDSACAVYDALARPQSVDELRDLVGLSLHDTLKSVQALLDRKLARTLSMDELLAVAAEAQESGDLDRAARLLDKAQLQAPHDRAILEKCVEVFGRLNQQRPLANYLAILGKVCFVAGETEAAIEHLEEALRSDASHVGALATLRDAYAQIGDAERVAEVSLRLARAQADRGELDAAIETCRSGIEEAPQAIALRFFYAQALARASRVEEAREEMHVVIRATESAKTASSDKAYELLANCYRLLLKIDPGDAEAEKGLQEIDRRRMVLLRRKKIVTRGGAAAALLLVLVGLGLVTGGPDAEALKDEIRKAHQRNNAARVLELVDELVEAHPDSPEAKWALELKGRLVTEASQVDVVKRDRDKKLRAEIGTFVEEARGAISDKPCGEAMAAVRRLAEQLGKPEMATLRKATADQFDHDLTTYFDRVREQFENDQKQVAAGEVHLRPLKGNAAGLREMEARLEVVRQRDWDQVAPDVAQSLLAIAASQAMTKATTEKATQLGKLFATGPESFKSLEPLIQAVRRERLEAETLDLHRAASTKGQELLTKCEFEEAKALYVALQAKLDEVTDQEPRDFFRELSYQFDARKIPQQAQMQLDRIESVTRTLRDVADLREKGRYAAAYRVMRDLVSENRLIQFENKYKLPYHVVSVPAGAEVSVNGVPAGRAPCEIELDIEQKPMTVKLRRAGFQDTEVRIVPTDPALDGTLRADLVKELAWEKELGGGVEAYPAIATAKDAEGRRQDLLLLATTDASLLAIDLATGDRAWEARTGLLHRIKARPTVAGTSVYLITLDGILHQIRLSDGKLLERLDLGAQVDQDPAVQGDTIYIATRKPALVALRAGKILWSEPLEESPSTPVVCLDGKLYVGTTKGAILVRDAKTGATRPEFRVASSTSFWGGLAVHKDLLLAGGEDGKLYAFDTRTGSQAWAHATGGPLAAPATSVGERIFVPVRDGYIHVLTAAGEQVERLDMGYAVKARPASAGEFLYFLGSNRAKAFDASGVLWWDRAFDGEFPAHVIAGGERIVIVTDKPWIHALPKDVK